MPIDPPTLSMAFSVNDSPFAGQEGNKLTSGVIKERLRKEGETNVSLQITQNDNGESFEVCIVNNELLLNELMNCNCTDDISPSIL